MILYTPGDGSIQFDSNKFFSFTGVFNEMYSAGRVVFKALKVSGTESLNGSWEDYSEGAYERARVSRWN